MDGRPHDWSSAKRRARRPMLLIKFYPVGYRIPDLVSLRRTLTNGCPHGQPPTRAEDQHYVPLTDLGTGNTKTTVTEQRPDIRPMRITRPGT